MKYLLYLFLMVGVTAVSAYLRVVFTPTTLTHTTTYPALPTVYPLDQAPSATLIGAIATRSGDIQFIGRTATEAAVLAATKMTALQGEKFLTGNQSALTIAFNSQPLIKMEAETAVELIQTLPDQLVFSQTSGKAEYNANSAISVRVPRLLLEINGVTHIDLTDDTHEVVVKSGKAVAAYNDADFVSHKQEIHPGQTFRFNADTRTGALK